MQLVSLRTHFSNHHKKANEVRLELMIPFQIDVMHAYQNIINNGEVHIIILVIIPLRLTLLCMPKGYFFIFHLLDYIAYILLSSFVWMHTPQQIHYNPNSLPIK